VRAPSFTRFFVLPPKCARQGTVSTVPGQDSSPRARHFERSDPVFSGASFLGAGSRREKSLFVLFPSLTLSESTLAKVQQNKRL
jgi:hypothetical protein